MKKWLLSCLFALLVLLAASASAVSVSATKPGFKVTAHWSCGNADHENNISIEMLECERELGKRARIKYRVTNSCTQCNISNRSDLSNQTFPSVGYPGVACTEPINTVPFTNLYGVRIELHADPVEHAWDKGTCTKCNGTCSHSGSTNQPDCTTSATCTICDGTISALGHDLVTSDSSPATCTEAGYEIRVCQREGCDYSTREVISAPGHDLEPHEGKPATCTEDGWTAYDTCKNCDYSNRKVIPALNHDLELRAKKAPTCSEKGWKKYVCTREGCNYVARIDVYTTSHDLVHHDAKAPTCTEIGWDAYDTCKNCDYTTYAELTALGHDLVKHDAKDATCTEGGWDAYDACSRCDYTTYAERAAKGHDLVKHAAKAPTCTEVGWDAYDACSRCDYSTYAELAAKGHDLVKHAAKAPTCTDAGWEAYDACSRCDYTTYQVKAALGHDDQVQTITPTCTEQGYDEHTCSRCANRYSDNWVNALGHLFVDWAPAENETHTAACLREGCGAVVTVECFRFTFTLPVEGEEAPLEISFCPICGGLNDELALTRIETATAEAVTGALPMGDLCLRIGALDNGEMLMTVCFEHDGAPLLPTGQVKITLPAELIEGSTLVLLCEDGTLTELAPEIDGESASFTLDFTDAESPVCALRLAG